MSKSEAKVDNSTVTTELLTAGYIREIDFDPDRIVPLSLINLCNEYYYLPPFMCGFINYFEPETFKAKILDLHSLHV